MNFILMKTMIVINVLLIYLLIMMKLANDYKRSLDKNQEVKNNE